MAKPDSTTACSAASSDPSRFAHLSDCSGMCCGREGCINQTAAHTATLWLSTWWRRHSAGTQPALPGAACVPFALCRNLLSTAQGELVKSVLGYPAHECLCCSVLLYQGYSSRGTRNMPFQHTEHRRDAQVPSTAPALQTHATFRVCMETLSISVRYLQG